MKKHFRKNHKTDWLNRQIICHLCRKGFEAGVKFEEHEKLSHKFGCKLCHKAFVLEVDLNHHVEKHHVDKSINHKEGFTCKLCEVHIGKMEMFKIHQSQGHNAPCYLDGCDKRFQHKNELLVHLNSVHNIDQITVSVEGSKLGCNLFQLKDWVGC